MKIVTVEFDFCGNNMYRRLYEVFRKSCAAVMPNVKFEPVFIAAPALKAGYSQGMNANVHKLRVWARVLEQSTETVCFCDCDMIALQSVENVDRMDFDLAYTKRQSTRIPINGGVVFVRPTEGGKALMRKWDELDEMMFENHTFHQKYRSRYAGMNQAAFGCLIEQFPKLGTLLALPCAEYNSCCDTWRTIDSGQARLVHIKGPFRRGLVGNAPLLTFQAHLRKTVQLWRSYEGEAVPDLSSRASILSSVLPGSYRPEPVSADGRSRLDVAAGIQRGLGIGIGPRRPRRRSV